ncbi:hypothetical protein SynBIOSU31_02264 [Synechococcus sp. BIOS-U3-1]|nr:hypothetical protein SynBIOSU31_02264 [Synechococcus sp. BIOS-U3-1]
MVSSGAWFGKGLPESTNILGAWFQLFSSAWNRFVSWVLGSWIQPWLGIVCVG